MCDRIQHGPFAERDVFFIMEYMDCIPSFSVTSFSEYCVLTEFIRRHWSVRLNRRSYEEQSVSEIYVEQSVSEISPWFRGASNVDYPLTPTLAREWLNYSNFFSSIGELENYYFNGFTRSARPFLLQDVAPEDAIEWNYIMRHHGIPSRLLDWTNSSLIALSYASEACTNGDNNKPYDAVVWMLEPTRLMEMATQSIGDPHVIREIDSRDLRVRAMRRDFFLTNPINDNTSEGLFFSDNQLSNNFLFHSDEYWQFPIPLIPSHVSARVISHRSRFTLHSLRSFWSQHPPPPRDNGLYDFAERAYEMDRFWYLIKIILPGECLLEIARGLRMTGMADVNLSQDLDGICRDLKQRFRLGFTINQ